MQTTDSVRSVKGVGEKAEQNLHKLKIETVARYLAIATAEFLLCVIS